MTDWRLIELLEHCAEVGLEVEWKDLGERRRGEYRWWRGTIVLHRRLTDAQAIACLGHELGHHIFGDTCSTPAGERRAWEYAAALLVTPEEYAEAEQKVGAHKGALAVELGVTPRLIEAWRSWWHKRGRHLPAASLRRSEVLTCQQITSDEPVLDPDERDPFRLNGTD